MNPNLSQYAVGLALAAVSGAVLALPFSVTGASGLPGMPVVVKLNDASTVALDAATVLIEFDVSRLDYVSSVAGNLLPSGTIQFENLLDEASGRVILTFGANANPLTGGIGSLLDVTFDILAAAPVGLITVSFRCVPIDPQHLVSAVTDQTSADQLCAPDYAIPATSGNVNVLAAPAGQAPISGTFPLALLGLGLIGWMRRKV